MLALTASSSDLGVKLKCIRESWFATMEESDPQAFGRLPIWMSRTGCLIDPSVQVGARYISLCAFLVLAVCLNPNIAAAELSGDWKYIGREADGTEAEVFVYESKVQDYGEGNFFVPKFKRFTTTVSGIEFPDGSGGTWVDTRYAYKSVLEWSIYDCPRRLIAVSETHYFSTNSPSSAGLVYLKKEGDPLLFPELYPDPVFDFVCP